jgi:hypothetical protein
VIVKPVVSKRTEPHPLSHGSSRNRLALRLEMHQSGVMRGVSEQGRGTALGKERPRTPK